MVVVGEVICSSMGEDGMGREEVVSCLCKEVGVTEMVVGVSCSGRLVMEEVWICSGMSVTEMKMEEVEICSSMLVLEAVESCSGRLEMTVVVICSS